MGGMNRTRGVQMVMALLILICPALVWGEKLGFRPDRAEWLEFGGEARMDIIVPEKADSYIEMDRVEIDLKAIITAGVYTKGTVRFLHEKGEKEADVDLPMWYTRFSHGAHWLRAGLTDRFIEPGEMDEGSRKTAGYPLSGNLFWRDEQYNVTLGGMFLFLGGDIRYRLSAGTGLALDDRRPGDHKFDYEDEINIEERVGIIDDTIGIIDDTTWEGIRDELFHDEDHGQHGDEFAIGLGYRRHFYPEASLDLVGFAIRSRVRPEVGDDEPAGEDLIGWPDDKQQRIGGRIVFAAEMPVALGEAEPLFMAEYIVAKDGKLNRNSWYVQASYELSFARPLIAGRFLTEIEPLIRYGQYVVDVEKDFYDPLTWDRTQLTGALLIDIVDNVSLRIEYDMNTETTGGDEILNDELSVQLRTRW